jgi:hypothetical protein
MGTQSCIERLKDRDIAHIPLVTPTLMALEIGYRKLTNRASRGYVYCPGLILRDAGLIDWS